MYRRAHGKLEQLAQLLYLHKGHPPLHERACICQPPTRARVAQKSIANEFQKWDLLFVGTTPKGKKTLLSADQSRPNRRSLEISSHLETKLYFSFRRREKPPAVHAAPPLEPALTFALIHTLRPPDRVLTCDLGGGTAGETFGTTQTRHYESLKSPYSLAGSRGRPASELDVGPRFSCPNGLIGAASRITLPYWTNWFWSLVIRA